MTAKIILALKFVAMISTVILSLIAILYVLDVFSGEYAKQLVLKIMSIMGILTAASLVTIFLTTSKT